MSTLDETTQKIHVLAGLRKAVVNFPTANTQIAEARKGYQHHLDRAHEYLDRGLAEPANSENDRRFVNHDILATMHQDAVNHYEQGDVSAGNKKMELIRRAYSYNTMIPPDEQRPR